MIEKNIFQTFKTKKIDAKILEIIDKTKSLNPNYAYYFYDDNDIYDFIKSNFDNEIVNSYPKLQIGAAKADFWRYLVLYKYGGVYLDLDSFVATALDNFILNSDRSVITRESNPPHFVQWCLICESQHPILKHTIQEVLKKIHENNENRLNYLTGPPVMSEAIEKTYRKLGFDSLYYANDEDINLKMSEKANNECRFIGIDFNNSNFVFKHGYYQLLYQDKLPWLEEQKLKKVID